RRGEQGCLVGVGEDDGVISGRKGPHESGGEGVAQESLIVRHVVIARIANVRRSLVVELRRDGRASILRPIDSHLVAGTPAGVAKYTPAVPASRRVTPRSARARHIMSSVSRPRRVTSLAA